MNGGPKDTPATPDRLRQDQIFSESLAKVSKANEAGTRASASEDVEEPESDESAQDREADGEEERGDDRGSEPTDELPPGIKERLKRAGLDAANLPPDVAKAIAKVHRSMESDHGRKSQEVAKARKELEAELAEYKAWKASIDRYKTLPKSKRSAIDRLFNEDEPDGDEPAESEDKELDEFLAEFDDDGRKIAKRHVDLAVKRAVAAANKENRELKERLDRLEQHTQQRTQADMQREAESELDAFNQAHPEYEDLDNDTKEVFEDAFEAHVQRLAKEGRRASLSDFYKRFFNVIDQRASGKAKETVRNLATRAASAPVQSPRVAGAPRPKQHDLSGGHRAVFAAAARKKGLRI